jgi:hypothetical protein
VAAWYLFPNLVCLDQEKSSNPASVPKKVLQENVAIKLGGGKLDLFRVA